MSRFGSVTRCLIANRFGKLIAEIQPDLGSISWRLNEVGRVQFRLSRANALVTASNLAFGNFLYIEFDNGLPAWAGLIDPPRVWANGLVEMTAYSAEYVLSLRSTDKTLGFTSTEVGTIFRTLIENANSAAPTGITIGDVWLGGDLHTVEYHYANLLNTIQDDLCERMSAADFGIVPSLSSGYVNLIANFYSKRGLVKNGVALIQGHNAEITLTEQGPIINSWDLAGATPSGSSSTGGWGDDRLTSQDYDPASINAYGLRSGASIFGAVETQDVLDSYAANLLASSKDPKNLIGVSTHNQEPALFSAYHIGDTVRLVAHDLGFVEGIDTLVRILSREFNPVDGSCSLVVEEVQS